MAAAIKTDLPTTADFLGFTPYRDALINIAQTAQTPIAIGIFGQWGSGKTSLMHMIKQQLDLKVDSHCLTVWFNAWKYDHEEALWRALLLHLTQAIRFVEDKVQHTKE